MRPLRARREFPSEDPALPKTDFPGIFRSCPRSLRCGNKHSWRPLFCQRNIRRVLLAPDHLPVHPGGGGRVSYLAGAPFREGLLSHVLGQKFLLIRRGKSTQGPVYMALGIKPGGRRGVLVFGCLVQKVRAPGTIYGRCSMVFGGEA